MALLETAVRYRKDNDDQRLQVELVALLKGLDPDAVVTVITFLASMFATITANRPEHAVNYLARTRRYLMTALE